MQETSILTIYGRECYFRSRTQRLSQPGRHDSSCSKCSVIPAEHASHNQKYSSAPAPGDPTLEYLPLPAVCGVSSDMNRSPEYLESDPHDELAAADVLVRQEQGDEEEDDDEQDEEDGGSDDDERDNESDAGYSE